MKLKRIILSTLLVGASLFALTSCEGKTTTSTEKNVATSTQEEATSTIEEPVTSSTEEETTSTTKERIKYDYDFHTEDQANYLALDNPDLFSLYAKAKEEKTAPNALHFDLENVAATDSVELYRKSDNKLIDTFTGPSIDIYNLELNAEYVIKTADTIKVTFKTPDISLRNLYIDGVNNVRDLGGWHDTEGNMLKQGLIYRSARFSEDETGVTTVTASGIDAFVNKLGLKTEIDLRTTSDSGGITESPLGSSVKYCSVPMQSGGNIITLNKELIKQFFEILGDETNYPLVFHCSIGTDRTGCMACTLEALLGVSKDDIKRDYLFSNFSNISRMRTSSIIDDYFEQFESAEGANLAEQTYNYLIGIGVAKADLDKVISLMK